MTVGPSAWRAAIVASIGALAVSSAARAQEPAQRRVTLHLEDCLGADAAAVRRILAAELGEVLVGIEIERGAPDAESQPPESEDENLLVHATCGVESAIVAVSQARAGLRLERRVDLANPAPNARARLLALSIAELVASAWAALDALPAIAPPAPAVEAEPAPAWVARPPRLLAPPALPPARPQPPASPTRPLGIRLMVVARVSGSPVHVSAGGGLGIEIGLPLSFGIGADLRYEQGEADAGRLGRAALRVAWGTLLGLVRPLVDWSSLTIGIGVKLGVAWLEGLPSAADVIGRTHADFVAGPAIAAHVALHVAGSGYLHVGLELSWITLGVGGVDAATGEILASFAGPQLAVTAGFEIQPSR